MPLAVNVQYPQAMVAAGIVFLAATEIEWKKLEENSIFIVRRRAAECAAYVSCVARGLQYAQYFTNNKCCETRIAPRPTKSVCADGTYARWHKPSPYKYFISKCNKKNPQNERTWPLCIRSFVLTMYRLQLRSIVGDEHARRTSYANRKYIKTMLIDSTSEHST